MGIDLPAMIRNNERSFGISKSVDKETKTPFKRLLVPFSIARGIVYSDTAVLVTSQLRIKASGKVNIFKDRLDIKLKPELVKTPKAKNQDPELLVPVHISGPFSDPEFKPDIR